jgi:hypothetical protein
LDVEPVPLPVLEEPEPLVLVSPVVLLPVPVVLPEPPVPMPLPESVAEVPEPLELELPSAAYKAGETERRAAVRNCNAFVLFFMMPPGLRVVGLP